ncbi:MAG: chorismate--pyruvate lyase family protein [Pseudomonadota bacterium]
MGGWARRVGHARRPVECAWNVQTGMSMPPPSQPRAPLAWLHAPGSLTRHLARVCGEAPRVDVMAEGWVRAAVDEARLLGIRAGGRIWRREVRLGCGSVSYVHAVTLASASTVRSLGLGRLGVRPLGRLLFRRGARRLAREILRPHAGQAWGRRTLYLMGRHRLLVQECFLPGVPPRRR